MPSPYRAIDESMENATQTDLRLLYGIGVPFVLGIALIIGFILAPSWWVLVPLLATLIVFAVVVVYGIFRMLAESE